MSKIFPRRSALRAGELCVILGKKSTRFARNGASRQLGPSNTYYKSLVVFAGWPEHRRRLHFHQVESKKDSLCRRRLT